MPLPHTPNSAPFFSLLESKMTPWGVTADILNGETVVVGDFWGSLFRWAYGREIERLGTLRSDDHQCLASAISAGGETIVGSSGSPIQVIWNPPPGVESPRVHEAFRWTSDSGFEGLGFLPTFEFSRASAISGDGRVIVGSSFDIDAVQHTGCSQAFSWTADQGMRILESFAGTGGTVSNTASGASLHGNVIVGADRNEEGRLRAVFWEDGRIRLIEDLPGSGLSSAIGVSWDGEIIVGYSYICELEAYQPWRWTEDGGTKRLDIPPPYLGGHAYSVSADGHFIIGLVRDADGRLRQPCFWDTKDGSYSMHLLADVIGAQGAGPVSDAIGIPRAVSTGGVSGVGKTACIVGQGISIHVPSWIACIERDEYSSG